MNDLSLAVSGWVASDPKFHATNTGTKVCSFRLASTSRFYDREKSAWVDGRTEWFTVKVFRSGAQHALDSIKKGQPVLVTGKFRTSEWEAEDGTRKDLVIEAASFGHDLMRGTATFERASAGQSEDAGGLDESAEALSDPEGVLAA